MTGLHELSLTAAVILVAEVLQIYSYGGRGYDYWRYCFVA